VIDLLTMKAYEFDKGDPTEIAFPEQLRERRTNCATNCWKPCRSRDTLAELYLEEKRSRRTAP
jgi:hypothetical protein